MLNIYKVLGSNSSNTHTNMVADLIILVSVKNHIHSNFFQVLLTLTLPMTQFVQWFSGKHHPDRRLWLPTLAPGVLVLFTKKFPAGDPQTRTQDSLAHTSGSYEEGIWVPCQGPAEHRYISSFGRPTPHSMLEKDNVVLSHLASGSSVTWQWVPDSA